jgi:hypothetical protein
MARTNSCSSPACFTDAISNEISLSDDEKELIRLSHRWLNVYCQHVKEPRMQIPEPRGTVLEAWSMLVMVSMFNGYSGFPKQQVQEAVPTPPDFILRVAALVSRLESSPKEQEDGRTLSCS